MIRSIFTIIFGVSLLVLSFPIGILILIFEKKEKYKGASKLTVFCVQFMAKAFCFLGGCDYEIEGLENLPEDRVVFVGNHQGDFDTFLIQFALGTPKISMTKKEALYVPIANLWLYLLRCIFVDRKNMRKAIKSMEESRKYLEHGQSILYFPEGTRSKGPNMGAFKYGAFKIAIETKTDIVPFVLDGTYKVFERQNYLKKEKVKFKILPKIDTKKYDDPKKLSEDVKAIMQKELDKIQSEEA